MTWNEAYALGFHPAIHTTNPVLSNTANGYIVRDATRVSIQLLDLRGNPLTEWFTEFAFIWPRFDGCPRLSGSEMRRKLYFATAPRDRSLHVSMWKTDLVRRIPGSR